MSKPPEEGRIWEWRAFGSVSRDLAVRVEGLPVRAGLKAVPDLDIYLISPTNNQNVKLRRLGSKWVLKLKLLLETTSTGIDLYRESMSMIYDLPASYEALEETARLLGTEISPRAERAGGTGRDELIELFRAAVPPVGVVEVPKVRSQYVVDRGWIELADAVFPKCQAQTISIHSRELQVVEANLADFNAGRGLDVMNYVEACRRWG